jgi:hypothetical protein
LPCPHNNILQQQQTKKQKKASCAFLHGLALQCYDDMHRAQANLNGTLGNSAKLQPTWQVRSITDDSHQNRIQYFKQFDEPQSHGHYASSETLESSWPWLAPDAARRNFLWTAARIVLQLGGVDHLERVALFHVRLLTGL